MGVFTLLRDIGMFKKNTNLNKWLWKWHVIAGLITMPFMLLLAITGVIYLFKADFNHQIYQSTLYVEKPTTNNIEKHSFEEQLLSARSYSDNNIVAVTVPTDDFQATAFKVKGKGFAANTLYINPYTTEKTGQIDEKETLMRLVRKLHGELLLDTPGTLVIELVASWFLVLLLTGVYIWWPTKSNDHPGFFTLRFKKGKRIFLRDLHAVSGFWLSALLLAVLAGAMPWTDVFGSNLKWVQEQTDSGYPKNWRNARGLESTMPIELPSSEKNALINTAFINNDLTTLSSTALTLDNVIALSAEYKLPGEITIGLPSSAAGVYTITNHSLWLSDQQVIHIDQYSGIVIKAYQWDDVGFLMDLRQVFMRFHQGEYGLVNWIVMLSVGIGFGVMNIAGLMSYLQRKSKGSWSIPKAPERFQVSFILIGIIILLGLLFPLFGGSLVLLWLFDKIKLMMNKREV